MRWTRNSFLRRLKSRMVLPNISIAYRIGKAELSVFQGNEKLGYNRENALSLWLLKNHKREFEIREFVFHKIKKENIFSGNDPLFLNCLHLFCLQVPKNLIKSRNQFFREDFFGPPQICFLFLYNSSKTKKN